MTSRRFTKRFTVPVAFMICSPLQAQGMADAQAEAVTVSEGAIADAEALADEAYDLTSNSVPVAKSYWYPRPEPADYPASSYVNGEEGGVRIALSVDADGKVTGCNVTESSGFPALDAKSCEVAMRDGPDFEPAKDEEGNPIAEVYDTDLYWQIRKPEFADSTEVDVIMTVNPDGSLSDCEILTLEGEFAEELSKKKSPCDDFSRRQAPYRDAKGVPVRKSVRLTLRVVVDDVAAEAEQ